MLIDFRSCFLKETRDKVFCYGSFLNALQFSVFTMFTILTIYMFLQELFNQSWTNYSNIRRKWFVTFKRSSWRSAILTQCWRYLYWMSVTWKQFWHLRECVNISDEDCLEKCQQRIQWEKQHWNSFREWWETFINEDCLTWMEKVLISSIGQETGTEQ